MASLRLFGEPEDGPHDLLSPAHSDSDAASAPADRDGLFYDAVAGLWKSEPAFLAPHIDVAGVMNVLPGWYFDSSANAAYPANELLFIPIYVSQITSYKRIRIEVGVAATGTARLGIYNWNAGLLGGLVLDAGTVDISTIGVKSITITQTLDPGFYFLAVVCDAAPSLKSPATGRAVCPPVSGFRAIAENRMDTVISGTTGRGGDVAGGLPDPAPAPNTRKTADFAFVFLVET